MKKQKIAGYKDLKYLKTRDNGENFVMVNYYDSGILYKYIKGFQKDCFLVRQTVARKLAQANEVLQKNYKDSCLLVTYGYRDINTQKRYFKKERNRLKRIYPDLSEETLTEKVHQNIAVPEVAGHPTGGAVDLTIYSRTRKEKWDMGSDIMDFLNGSNFTFSSNISTEQQRNRFYLRDLMMAQGFAPFYLEWWHFCYGDKEWAWFYDREEAIYGQV